MKNFVYVLAITMPVTFPSLASGYVSETGQHATYDCGISSLYMLLSLHSINTNMNLLEKSLPPAHPEGYSLQELINSAYKQGLSLKGVRLVNSTSAPKSSAIIYLDRKTHGHYIVIRPVGKSGRLVQILDSDEPPTIIEFSSLQKRRDWTGIALVESQSNSFAILAILVTGVSICYLFVQRARKARKEKA